MLQTILKYFDDLTIPELYDILQLREEVFQIEQNCIYKDIDDKDKKCFHLMLYKEQELVAYCRLVPAGISYDGYASIGRVVSKPIYRKDGFGKQLMEQAMQKMTQIFSHLPIKISAQAYLQKFYESFGFVRVSDEYMEDDIPHIAMVFGQ
ncbi:MAG: GNAT family N-acetyltransferase [Saprospirales bacterium]|nr:GNAT family N-acetyltransferase [Saprospirales bacterium]